MNSDEITSMMTLHFRLSDRSLYGVEGDVSPKSGATVVFVPEKRRFGIALCCAKDRFNRKLGRKIAIARAMQPKVRSRDRFDHSPSFTGQMTKDKVKAHAIELIEVAVMVVNNPLRNCTLSKWTSKDTQKTI